MTRKSILLAAATVLVTACDKPSPVEPIAAGPGELLMGIGVHGAGPPASVVFYSSRASAPGIYSMNPDGTDEQRLFDAAGTEVWPDISPNGRHLVYTSNSTGNNEIYVMDLRTGDIANVTNNSADDNWARWSPNGHELVFHSNRGGNYNIWVLSLRDSTLHQVTTSSVLDQWPDWSPDGKQILFRRGQNLSVADADGTEQNIAQLTFSSAPTINQMGVYSPDGKSIAFMSSRAGYPSVWLMSVDGEAGAAAVNLTPKDPADASALWLSRAPAWSKNGKQIYFMSFRPSTSGDVELFMMDADGSDVMRLTNSPGEDGGPQAR